MKKLYFYFLFLFSSFLYSQTNGITYQAVILNPEGEKIPGYNNERTPLINKNICLRFKITTGASQLEYQENLATTTDEFGMVNVIIGSGIPSGGLVATFSEVVWNGNPKQLTVEVDLRGNCSSFIEISNQPFTAVPYALYSANSGTTGSQGIQGIKGDTGLQGPKGDKGDVGIQGIQGLKGDTGLQGPKGDKGDVGIQGLKGDTGLTGANGINGVDGLQGLKGDKGDAGIDGFQGIQGLKGDTGLTGAIGLQGMKGDAGIDGSQGIQGLKGDTGMTGAIGPQGMKGDKGDAGTDGVNGANGVDGSQGIQGLKGDTGLQGMQGPKGDAGATGIDGPQGIQGLKGDTGLTGAIGPQGIKGDKGDAGIDGVNGANGVDGSQGIQGLQGDKGDIGLTGDTGQQGIQGPQGIQGLKGDTGLTGAIGPQGMKGDKGDAGFDGANGANGVDGPQGLQGDKGDIGLKGDTGQQGLAGANGINTLVNTTTELAGANCANGGTKIEVGLDLNNNGTLDSGEVNANLTKYVCNGTNATGGSSSGAHMQVFTAGTHNWTVPTGVTSVIVEMCGGGGAGGPSAFCQSTNGFIAGRSGGSGGYGKQSISVLPNSVYIVTVGAGGNPLGNPGGMSSFDVLYATGGDGAPLSYPSWYCNATVNNGTSNAIMNCCNNIGYGNGGGANSNGTNGVVIISW